MTLSSPSPPSARPFRPEQRGWKGSCRPASHPPRVHHVPKLPLASTLPQFCHVFRWTCPHPKPSMSTTVRSARRRAFSCARIPAQPEPSPGREPGGREDPTDRIQWGWGFQPPQLPRAWPGAQRISLPDSGRLVGRGSQGQTRVERWVGRGGGAHQPLAGSQVLQGARAGLQGGILLALAHEVQVGADGIRVVQPAAALGVGLFLGKRAVVVVVLGTRGRLQG